MTAQPKKNLLPRGVWTQLVPMRLMAPQRYQVLRVRQLHLWQCSRLPPQQKEIPQ